MGKGKLQGEGGRRESLFDGERNYEISPETHIYTQLPLGGEWRLKPTFYETTHTFTYGRNTWALGVEAGGIKDPAFGYSAPTREPPVGTQSEPHPIDFPIKDEIRKALPPPIPVHCNLNPSEYLPHPTTPTQVPLVNHGRSEWSRLCKYKSEP